MNPGRLAIAIKALFQLGPTQVALNALYKFGLASGHYRRAIRPPEYIPSLRIKALAPMPPAGELLQILGETGRRRLIAEADEIKGGYFRQFGAEPAPITLTPSTPLDHWTVYESGKDIGQKTWDDIKFIWEPARFGWAFVLGRAYTISGDESYALAFWELFETFMRANPAYLGPNWTSGQEAGLRLIAWVWAGQVFARSEHSSPERLASLANAAATHAARIPGTLVYARSQNNNHLLTEAAALYTAGLALPSHPLAAKWLKQGRRWLSWCFIHQIDDTGEYVQHSMNYQRLMLQTALWVEAIQKHDEEGEAARPIQGIGRKNLGLAANWLIERLDPESGQAPNLGANDGALIMPLSIGDFGDFRPAAQTASHAFSGAGLPSGAWDEMPLWYGLDGKAEDLAKPAAQEGQIYAQNSWASLRAVHYRSRPSHADQLHCDLWWQGLNIARDAGTYRYTSSPPWNNQLTSTLVHNTVSVNGVEQMTRAGQFLYLDWAQAEYIPNPAGSVGPERGISARTEAYARFNVRHERSVSIKDENTWLVEDNLLHQPSDQPSAPTYRLHWLLPDWEWRMEEATAKRTLQMLSPHGWISVAVGSNRPLLRVGLVRAGNILYGDGLVSATFGWYSPTYNVKNPALSLALEVQSAGDAQFTTEFIFPTGI